MSEQITEERLRKMEVQQAEILTLLRGLSEKIDGRIYATDNWRHRVDLILVGDGNQVKGHTVRLSSLESDRERSKWIMRTIGGGLLFLLLQALSSF